VARASLRRFVEQEAGDHFRPEVLARFTAVLVFGHLSREVQVRICKRMLDDETSFQSSVLEAAFGHPHRVRARADVGPRLVSEGWHRRLGARPMRNVVERRVRTALVEARLRGALVEGVRETVLLPDGHAGLRAGLARAPFVL
jgi:ATP-dependent Clp protease ATP-binding subunit ClpB